MYHNILNVTLYCKADDLNFTTCRENCPTPHQKKHIGDSAFYMHRYSKKGNSINDTQTKYMYKQTLKLPYFLYLILNFYLQSKNIILRNESITFFFKGAAFLNLGTGFFDDISIGLKFKVYILSLSFLTLYYKMKQT